MVAKTPTKHKKMVAPPPLNPTLLRETVKKVDRCMARLQELQYTVSGGTKVISGVNLSPRSTRGYLRTSIRCKQETLRMKNSATRKSPVGKFQGSLGGEWQRMSLPAMLVGETVGEILQASQFAREVVEAVASKTKRTVCDDPKTPVSKRRSPNSKVNYENTELKARRKREKQVVLQLIRSESSPPSLQRARSRINFKVSPKKRDVGKENWFVANRVSPKNKPWAKKTVLFPNPLFLSSPSTQQHKVSKTRSPVIMKTRQTTPHKFLIKSPPSTRSPVTKTRQTTPHKFLIKSPPSNSKFQVKIKNAPVSLSPTRPASLNKRSPPSNSKFQVKIKNAPVSLSPTRPANLNKRSPKKSPPKKMSTASKLRRSFSPSRLANRFVSPLKSRMSTQQKSGSFMSGLKQRPSSPMRFSGWKL